MKKYIIMLLVGILAAFGLTILSGVQSANATEEPCVPSDAWTETIEHEAVTHEVFHPEVTEVVYHEAITHIEYHFAKFTHTQYKVRGQWGDYGPWTKWVPETHTSWELNTTPLGQPAFHGEGKDWYRQWQAQFDGLTRTVTDEEAWEEVVVIEEAYTEIVIDKEAWTETIYHPAVTCAGEQPDPVVTVETSSSYECGDTFETVVTRTTTQGWVLNLLTNVWEPGKPIVDETSEQIPHKVVPCDVPEEPETPGQPTKSQECVGGALVIKTTDAKGNKTSSTENGSSKCSQKNDFGTPIVEEGM